MVTVQSGDGITIRAAILDEFDFLLSAVQTSDIVFDGTSEDSVIDDANVTSYTSATEDSRFEIDVIPVVGGFDGIELELIGDAGALQGTSVTRVSDGDVVVLAKHPLLARRIELTLARSGGVTAVERTSYVNGSLAKHITEYFSSRAVGKTSANVPYFSSKPSNGAWVKNADCWVADFDLSCFSYWNNVGGSFLSGVAVSPLHTLHLSHSEVPVGSVLKFLTTAGEYVDRTIIAKSVLAGGNETDTTVAKLNEALPESVTVARLMPPNVLDYLPTIDSYRVPALSFDQERKAIAKDFCGVVTDSYGPRLIIRNAREAPFIALTESITFGDSGSPSFFCINGQTVLVSHWTSGNYGPKLHLLHDEINATMASLGGGYQLTEIDLTGFNSY